MSIELNGSVGIKQNTTEVTKIPVGTTAQRPANPEAGMIRFNTDEGEIEGFDGAEWGSVGGIPTVLATGGTETIIEQDGELFRVHTFTSDGTFDVTRGGDVEYLVVGGGGAAARQNGIGGSPGAGAGGLVFLPNGSVTNGSHAVVVGNGGVAITSNVVGANGENSSFLDVTAIGGGGGGDANNPGNDGGSGGGSKNFARSVGLQPAETGDSGAPFGFGNGGGRFLSGGGNTRGGGGGGAGEAGEDQDAPTKGKGGDGLNEVIINGVTYNFNSIFQTSFGESVNGETYFAGGGGRGGTSAGSGDTGSLPGGLGGGGDGGSGSSGSGDSGAPTTGGGGGGTRAGTPGSGGSGIVIVRYKIG